VVRVDLKGFGDSPKPLDDAYAISDQADCVRALISELGLESVVLVGNSLGGAVSLVLAAAEPALVSKVIAIAAPSHPDDVPKALGLARLKPVQWVLRNWPIRALLPFVLPRVYGNRQVLTDDHVDALTERLDQAGTRHAVIETARHSARMELAKLRFEPARVTMPALVLWGENDRIIPRRAGEQLERELPDARLVMIEKCGHCPQEERPAETAAAILDFLG